MKTICYFINSDWYFDLHWLERALASKNKYEVHLIARFTDELILEKLCALGFICHPISLKERSMSPFGFCISAAKVFKILSKIKPDILHSITIKPIVLGGIYAKLYKTSFVANIVGLGRVFDSKGLIFFILKKTTLAIYKFILSNKKSFFIFEHEQDKKTLKDYIHFDEAQTSVIDGAGVDTNIFHYQRENNNLIPIVFFAGRMLKNKGLSTLVKLKRELKEEGIDFTLIVAGIEVKDDPQAIPAQTLEEWINSRDIVWLGMRRDIHKLISESNIVALPTTYPEGVPRILIEASAIGRVCIAYDSGGCKSIIKDQLTGFLVEKNNYPLFKKRISKLINNYELRIEMGVNGRELVKEKFSSSKVVSETLTIYENISSCN